MWESCAPCARKEHVLSVGRRGWEGSSTKLLKVASVHRAPAHIQPSCRGQNCLHLLHATPGSMHGAAGAVLMLEGKHCNRALNQGAAG